MTVRASAGRIEITDGSHLVFDTNEKLFHGTDYVTGSVSIPQREAVTHGSTPVVAYDNTYVYNLGPVNANADTVLGSFYVTASTYQGVANVGWFAIGGTYMHYYDAIDSLFSRNQHVVIGRAQAFTFRAQAGNLRLEERIVAVSPIHGEDITVTTKIFAINIQYKLYVGLFT